MKRRQRMLTTRGGVEVRWYSDEDVRMLDSRTAAMLRLGELVVAEWRGKGRRVADVPGHVVPELAEAMTEAIVLDMAAEGQ